MRFANSLFLKVVGALFIVALLFSIAGEDWRDAPKLALFLFLFVIYFVHTMTRSLLASTSYQNPASDSILPRPTRKEDATCEEIRGTSHD